MSLAADDAGSATLPDPGSRSLARTDLGWTAFSAAAFAAVLAFVWMVDEPALETGSVAAAAVLGGLLGVGAVVAVYRSRRVAATLADRYRRGGVVFGLALAVQVCLSLATGPTLVGGLAASVAAAATRALWYLRARS